MSHPLVRNLRTSTPPEERSDDVLVCRPYRWGNPFKIGPDGTREEVVEKYRTSLTDFQKQQARLTLKGKRLWCYCAPLPCHADVLAEIANGPATSAT